MRCRICAVLIALCGVLTSVSAGAQEPVPRHRITYLNFLVLRVNPLGLQNQFELDYQYRLYDSDSILFRTSHLRLFLAPTLTPALARLGIGAEIEPIAVLKIGARWEWLQYFGVLDHLQSFSTVDGDYSDTAIEAGGEADRHYAGGGWQLSLMAELRGKVGPVVARSRLVAQYADMSLRAGDTVWYDPYFDVLQPREGWTLINDADLLLFLLDDALIVGVRHNLTHTFYPTEAYGAAGEREVDDTQTQRLGPLIAYRFFDDPGAMFNRPTVVLLLNWYLEHPNRTGRDVHQGIPYVALGFAFSGDLL